VLDMVSQLRNPVVLTGDMHVAAVGDLRHEPAGSPTIGTEFVATSISSRPADDMVALLNALLPTLPQFPWANGSERGYSRAVVTPETFDVDFVVADALV